MSETCTSSCIYTYCYSTWTRHARLLSTAAADITSSCEILRYLSRWQEKQTISEDKRFCYYSGTQVECLG